MKKFISMAAIAAVTMVGFTSCDDNDDAPKYEAVEVSNGMYVVNAGNKSGGINGSLTYYDYASSKVSQGVFDAANNRKLGVTAESAVVYGSKIYIAVTGEKTIEIADSKTLKSVKQIDATTVGKGGQPRKIAAHDGKVYVSMYSISSEDKNGQIAVIDTASLEVVKTIDAGSYPEGIAIANGFLYVANSDYAKVTDASISKIDIKSYASTTIKGVENPQYMLSIDGDVFVIDNGHYDTSTGSYIQTNNAIYKVTESGVEKVAEGTMMAAAKGKLFFINSPYGKKITEYQVMDLASKKVSTFIDGTDIKAPCALAADPVTGNVFITSYNVDEKGKSLTKENGYAVVYDGNGNKVNEFVTGVGPSSMCFSTSTVQQIVK